MIYADNSSVNSGGNRDIVFGDHAEIMFDEDVSHKLEQAATIDAGCNGGSDVITLGAGDDMVCFITLSSSGLLRSPQRILPLFFSC